MLQETSISERRACTLVGLSRDSWRHAPVRAEADRHMSQRITQLAHERRRFGYRRIGDLLRADGTAINDKRVYRLYRLADLAVRKRRGRKRLRLERVPLHRCEAINEVWSMDFVSDSLANGRRIKCLTITDDFSHECVDIVGPAKFISRRRREAPDVQEQRVDSRTLRALTAAKASAKRLEQCPAGRWHAAANGC